MSLIRKHGAVLQAWACLDLVFSRVATVGKPIAYTVSVHDRKTAFSDAQEKIQLQCSFVMKHCQIIDYSNKF